MLSGWVLGQWLAHSVFFFIVRLVIYALFFCLIVKLATRALCFVIDGYVSDLRTLFCVWLLG